MEERRIDKLDFQAINAIKAHPYRLRTRAELIKIKGIGDKLADMILQRLPDYPADGEQPREANPALVASFADALKELNDEDFRGDYGEVEEEPKIARRMTLAAMGSPPSVRAAYETPKAMEEARISSQRSTASLPDDLFSRVAREVRSEFAAGETSESSTSPQKSRSPTSSQQHQRLPSPPTGARELPGRAHTRAVAIDDRAEASRRANKKPYEPKPETGNWAILVALYKYTGGKVGISIAEDVLRTHAEHFSRAPMYPTADNTYSAWSSLKRLLDEGYVRCLPAPTRYHLTDTGLPLATRLYSEFEARHTGTLVPGAARSGGIHDPNIPPIHQPIVSASSSPTRFDYSVITPVLSPNLSPTRSLSPESPGRLSSNFSNFESSIPLPQSPSSSNSFDYIPTVNNDLNTATQTETPKKKRGRPKKNAASPSVANSAASPATHVEPYILSASQPISLNAAHSIQPAPSPSRAKTTTSINSSNTLNSAPRSSIIDPLAHSSYPTQSLEWNSVGEISTPPGRAPQNRSQISLLPESSPPAPRSPQRANMDVIDLSDDVLAPLPPYQNWHASRDELFTPPSSPPLASRKRPKLAEEEDIITVSESDKSPKSAKSSRNNSPKKNGSNAAHAEPIPLRGWRREHYVPPNADTLTTFIRDVEVDRPNQNWRKPAPVPPLIESLPIIPLSDEFIELPAFYEHTICKIIVLVDVRERRKISVNIDYFEQMLEASGFESRTVQLSVGDYLWIGVDENQNSIVLDTIVERKRSDDLGESLQDGRFLDQKWRMRHTGLPNLYYFIEGPVLAKTTGFAIETEKMLAGIASTAYADSFTVFRPSNTRETGRHLISISKDISQRYLNQKIYSTTSMAFLEDIKVKHHGASNFEKFERCIVDDSNLYWTFEQFQERFKRKIDLKGTDLFALQLMTLLDMTPQAASAIILKFKSMPSLLKAYKSAATRQERIQLISHLRMANGQPIGTDLATFLLDTLVRGSLS